MPFQQTLSQVVEIAGVGLHTGQACRVRLKPACADVGIFFSCGGEKIPAKVDFVVSTERATVLGKGAARISTVEHLLAAVSATGLDNVEIEVEGPEIPVLDGSAAGFVEKIREAGKKRLSQPAQVKQLTAPVWVAEKESLLLALPASSFRLTYMGDFAGLGRQKRSFAISPSVFAEEIAPARTTVYREEVESLLARGLGKGGSLKNVVVLEAGGASTPLRFPDEPARHKILDLLGDLALLGGRLQAHVIAVRSGHRLNIELVKKINES